MIIGAKKGNYRKVLEAFENENSRVFSFDNSKVLPAEQREIFRRIFSEEHKERKTIKKVDQDLENRRREKMAQRIIEKLQDKRLKEPGKLNSFVYSAGGNNSNRLDNENAELQARGAKVNYAVMEINGIVIMEALGQFGNATYIAAKTQELEQKIIDMGRGKAIDERVIYKVIHDTKVGEDGYDYESEHLFEILEYAITSPRELINELKKNNKWCTMKTLSQRMSSVLQANGENIVDRIIDAVQACVDEKEITKEETLEEGKKRAEISKQNTDEEKKDVEDNEKNIDNEGGIKY